MSYRVSWIPSAEQDLAAAWLASTNRNTVSAAAHRLEHELQSDPFHVGESRESSVRRVAFESPLGIEFEIVEDDKKVRVLGAWLTS
jgi:hypothetical protein